MWFNESPILTITINTEEHLAIAKACDAFKKTLIEVGLFSNKQTIDMTFVKHGDTKYRVHLDWAMINPKNAGADLDLS